MGIPGLVGGAIVGLWERDGAGGHYPALAYQTAFLAIVVLQLAALLWLYAPVPLKRQWMPQLTPKP